MGLGLVDIFVQQGVEKLKYFIEERNSNTIAGHLVQTNYESTLLYLGLGEKELFQANYKTYKDLLPNI